MNKPVFSSKPHHTYIHKHKREREREREGIFVCFGRPLLSYVVPGYGKMHLRRPLWQTITQSHEASALERERELAVKKGNNKKSATLYQSETEKRDEEKKKKTRFTRQQQRSVSQLTQSRMNMVRDETEFTGTKGDNDEDPSQGGSSYRLQDYKIERERNTVKKKSHHHSWLSCVYAFHKKGKKKKIAPAMGRPSFATLEKERKNKT